MWGGARRLESDGWATQPTDPEGDERNTQELTYLSFFGEHVKGV